jgi:hypothetical protein
VIPLSIADWLGVCPVFVTLAVEAAVDKLPIFVYNLNVDGEVCRPFTEESPVTLVEPIYSSQSLQDIVEMYQVPLVKAKFYSHVITAWQAGQEVALEVFGEDTRPYDMALFGVTRILDVLGVYSAPFDLESFVSRIPSNADAIMVLNELRWCYPKLCERNRNGQHSNRREGITPARSATKRDRIRQE